MRRLKMSVAAASLVLLGGLLPSSAGAATGPVASHWCSRYQPHPAADREYPGGNSYWFSMGNGMATARCLAYEGSYPDGVTRLHYYHVTVADYDGDGDIDAHWWTPLSPYTW